ncbi:hypothetical protein PFL603g_00994 [Pseudomonas fluorescens]|uniref:Uncharacterized protein n=1 Tax=Pseudomonas fluorescens TaxID=294 RepID=A0A120G4N6_PSEFL|nr:hypothetical protein PFL603g_00994 [Pseudomonas fluorescens]
MTLVTRRDCANASSEGAISASGSVEIRLPLRYTASRLGCAPSPVGKVSIWVLPIPSERKSVIWLKSGAISRGFELRIKALRVLRDASIAADSGFRRIWLFCNDSRVRPCICPSAGGNSRNWLRDMSSQRTP